MPNSTQQSIPIAGIKDGIIILKSGGYRMVLEVSATNFALKSEQEQNSLVFQYQSFLNSLHFPIEIVVRSKRLDLAPYLNKVRQTSETSLNELIKMQIQDYVDFVSKLISLANIMKKTFYVVIPYDPISIKKLNIFDSLFAKTVTFDHLKIADTEFKSATDQLQERGNMIASGLASMGLHCFQLSTEEIIESFYQIYNPEESGKERVTDAAALSSAVVISKDEVKNPGETDESNFLRTVDNASQVEEQQKQSAQARKQESIKQGERQERAPEIQSQPAENQPASQVSTLPDNTVAPDNNPAPNSLPDQAPTNSTNSITPQNNGQ